jgi:hypothetical protein
MRLAVVLVTAIATAAPAAGQSSDPPKSATPPATTQDTSKSAKPDDPATSSPISVDKVHAALARPAGSSLKLADERPIFRVEVVERQKIEELLATLKYNGGPTPPGGVYGYEQQRLLFPPTDNPLMQPYAAFNQSELAQISIETIVETYLAKKAIAGLTRAVHGSAEANAREDVRRAIADYCSAQPRGGAGITICDNPPIR